ncbi:hypothetical protein [Lactobacillus delbrueckii]|nr:hypothetical protein [Lactobacillus delbrueckii]
MELFLLVRSSRKEIGSPKSAIQSDPQIWNSQFSRRARRVLKEHW